MDSKLKSVILLVALTAPAYGDEAGLLGKQVVLRGEVFGLAAEKAEDGGQPMRFYRVDRADGESCDVIDTETGARRHVAVADFVPIADAIAELTRRLELEPASAADFRDRGALRQRGDEIIESFADFAAALHFQPADPLVYLYQAAALADLRLYDHALARLAEATRLKPDFAPANHRRAEIWLLRGDNERAMTELNEAVRVGPDYAPAYRLRARRWLE
ncbi:MAG TPA: hypothetical protein VFI31_15530, partial [Pirellulales bacterium]|nr:hypothetical protein [Pirellulales bacterium]